MYTPRIEPEGEKKKNKHENTANAQRLAANGHQSIGAALQAMVGTTTTRATFYGWYDYYRNNFLRFVRQLRGQDFVFRTIRTSCVRCGFNTNRMKRHTHPLCWVWIRYLQHAAAAQRQTANLAQVSSSINR